MTKRMGENFTEGVVEGSMQSEEGVGMSGISEDSQPVFNWIEEGEVWPEGGDKLEEGEDIVEIVDALRDMF